ncbi:Fe2+-dependent dioxygenase [Ectothiorhodospiraceae bacterium BW-2]|nr:Fe2+-dependent dioxygenase [Ectothiorhodospiraceae bacterium BW-2]
MLYQLDNLLTAEELKAIRKTLEQSEGQFVDGKLSAGKEADTVKQNLELSRTAPQKEVLAKLIVGALYRHPLFSRIAYPAKISTPLFARYTAGMSYGTHIDDPIMGSDPYYRTDLSFTVFLTDPNEYEGGELTIQTHYAEQQAKLAAGSAVLYPSASLHRVAEVTAGVRMVAVGWLQSMIRDPVQRELLFTLSNARERLLQSRPGRRETFEVDYVLVNLTRMWSDV